MVGAVEGALKAHLVVREAGEGIEAGGVLDEGAGDELVGGQFGFVGLGIGFVLAVKPVFRRVVEGAVGGGLVLVEVGLDAGEAGELPIGDGHLFDQDFLEAVEGAVMGAEGFEKTFESVFVLAGKEGGAGAQSVFEGVAAGDGFSSGGSGASATEGVAAIGVYLFLSGHEKFKFGRRKPNRANGSSTNRLAGAGDAGGGGKWGTD